MIVPTIAEFIFWISTVLVLYVYIGYPLLVYFVSRLFPKKIRTAHFEPTVSIIITAYNEEQDIKRKIENTFTIDYPSEKLEIIIASDGSTDRTDQIVKEFSSNGVKLFRQEGRVGKTHTQNEAVEHAASGEVILFSDATTMYQPDVLKAILPNFADPTVGCVAGKLIYVDDSNSSVGTGARSYWNYESILKESESLACSLIGVSGCLYAVRRSAYRPMRADACSDFLICTVIFRQGLRTVFEPAAVCTEETNRHSDKEMTMRVRVIAQTINDLWNNREMLNPLKSGFYAVELVSHKLLRYAIPFFLILIFLSSCVAAFYSYFFVLILGCQAAFYALAFAAWMMEKSEIKLSFLALPLYFVLANFASLAGFYKFLRGERFASWDTGRQNEIAFISLKSETTNDAN